MGRDTLTERAEPGVVGPLSACLPEDDAGWVEVRAYVHTPEDGAPPYLVVDVDVYDEDTPLRVYVNDGEVYRQAADR